MALFVRYQPIVLGGGGGSSEAGVTAMAPFGTTPNDDGATIAVPLLTLQPADGTHPGGVSITTQSFLGQKTFLTGLTGTLTGHATLDVALSTLGNLTDAGTDGIVVTGGTGATVGNVSIAQHVADSTHNGYLSSTDWSTFNSKQPLLTIGNLTAAGTDGITVTNGTGAVIGSGTSVQQQAASTSLNGYLTSTDWNTFNGKQAAGNYITALTADVTATGPGSVASTVAAIQGKTVSGTTGTVNVVFSNTPTLVTPILGAATGTSLNLSSLTVSQAVVTDGSKNLVSLAYTPSATASTIASRDASGNVRFNNAIEGFTSTATAAGTTTLTVASTYNQQFTGSTTQTVVLPDATTLVVGQAFEILNRSSGVVTVNANGGGLVQTMAAASQTILTVTNIGSAAGVWDSAYSLVNAGTVSSVAASGPSGIATWSAAVTTSGTLTQTLSTQSAHTFLAGPTSGGAATPTFRTFTATDFTPPTVQKFTSGSGTYTTPTSPAPLYIKVKMVGGGGGGAGSGAASGAAGAGNGSSFGTLLLTASGGGAAGIGSTGAGGAGGSAGAASLGSGPIGTAISGGRGQGGGIGAVGTAFAGGNGGSNPLGGAGAGSAGDGASAGYAAVANSGGGGGGAGIFNVNLANGAGGGAGGYVDAIITSPLATYSYVVGAGGAGGTLGTTGFAGGNGGSGYIEVTEFYS